ncbi:MAG: crossover junction endodeoxyribonuclease RuvC [Patescibacteria group bacterium]|jgi:crossover junction endodeoxyribonuclease RuvC|nr:crossover junction endodeoxyribonuclease RuvC [Patescibacteria group bacterium]
MSKIILGIDPGIADTGFGVIKVERGKITCLTYGSIKTPKKTELSDRLETLYQDLDSLLKRYHPDLASVEQLFFNTNVTTALTVGQARGVALLALKQNKVPIVNFTPSQVKSSVCSYGKAPKLQVQKMVKSILKLEKLPQPDDAADALALAICASGARLEGC